MKNLKISKKLILSFGTIIIMLIVVVWVSFSGLISVSSNFSSYHNGSFKITNTVMELRRALSSVGGNINYAFSFNDYGKTKEYIDAAKDQFTIIDDAIINLDITTLGDLDTIYGIINMITS